MRIDAFLRQLQLPSNLSNHLSKLGHILLSLQHGPMLLLLAELQERDHARQHGWNCLPLPRTPSLIDLRAQHCLQRNIRFLFGYKLPNRIALFRFPGADNAAGTILNANFGGAVGFNTLHNELVRQKIGKDESVEAVRGSGVEGTLDAAGGGVDVEEGIEVKISGKDEVKLCKEFIRLFGDRLLVDVDGDARVQSLDSWLGSFGSLSRLSDWQNSRQRNVCAHVLSDMFL